MTNILITGISGQDGSYLADLMVEKGFNVFGLVRRSSNENMWRLWKCKDKITFIYGDLSDQSSLDRAVQKSNPDYVFNMGAMSFVGSSFQHPEQTMDVNATGVLRILEAIRKIKPTAKFIQASSSEMFGKVVEVPQKETTPFNGRSPYSVSKIASYHLVVLYRNAYNLFACNSICFNHECLTENTPIIIRENDLVDIVPIDEIVTHRKDHHKGKKYVSENYKNLEVWDGNKWTKIKTLTATWNDIKNDKKVKQIVCRGGYYEATEDHISFLEGEKEIKTGLIQKGERLELKEFPPLNNQTILTLEEAEFVGMMVADGYIHKNGKSKFAKNDDSLRERLTYLWKRISGGDTKDNKGISGFKSSHWVKYLNLIGNRDYLKFLHTEIYTESLYKRIPKRILNSNKEVIISFLKGYNKCDGLKRGKQISEFKSFTTNSPTLALGLWYLISKSMGLRITLHPEFRGNKKYYHLNMNSNNTKKTGQHLIKELSEVKDVRNINYNGWLFDLETESTTFSAGVGLTWVHNSPRRGIEFVTKKISTGVAKIKLGSNEPIVLGNINSRRDWGYAADYVEAMWLMLQQKTPDDYIIATGETHSIREFIEEAFKVVDMEIKWEGEGMNEVGKVGDRVVVKISPEFYRPAEVDLLIGDATKAREKLGWTPTMKFKELVKLMVTKDIKRFSTPNNVDSRFPNNRFSPTHGGLEEWNCPKCSLELFGTDICPRCDSRYNIALDKGFLGGKKYMGGSI